MRLTELFWVEYKLFNFPSLRMIHPGIWTLKKSKYASVLIIALKFMCTILSINVH